MATWLELSVTLVTLVFGALYPILKSQVKSFVLKGVTPKSNSRPWETVSPTLIVADDAPEVVEGEVCKIWFLLSE